MSVKKTASYFYKLSGLLHKMLLSLLYLAKMAKNQIKVLI